MVKIGEDDRSGLPQENTWLGGFHIGDGSFGTVHYWLKVDQNQNVLDRMVIKDLECADDTTEPPAYRGIYEELVRKGMDFGIGPSRPGKATIDERFLKEAYLQGLMTDTTTPFSATTVPLRGFKRGHRPPRVEKTRKGEKTYTHWRVYMDLLHAGDLENFIEPHKDKEGNKRPIPEAYIWWVFTCLANALVQMDCRVQNRSGARVERDEVIAMIDMKPGNVMMDHTRGKHYPVYPKPLLSDFGSAHILYKEDPKNVKGFKVACTRRWRAPEMSQWDYELRMWLQGVEKPLHSWTNVWQAGRIIECMMRLQKSLNHERDSIICMEESPIKDRDPPRIDGFPNFRYSQDLIDLVWHCQRLDPEQRPTPSELLELIKQRAPKHNRGMDEWGTAIWIQKREAAPPRPKTDDEVARRPESINLDFLDGYPPDWAERYRQLDVDLPIGCDLAFYGNKDPAKLNTRAIIHPREPTDPYASVIW